MAKKKAKETEEVKDASIVQLTSYLKKNKGDHYNFDEQVNWKVPTGSLLFDVELGGGFSSGLTAVSGSSFGGKSSCVAQCMFNFLNDVENSKGLWVKAEGRLDEEFIERSGIKFVYDPEEWVVGTCFVYESNIFESVTDLINELVKSNPNEVRYGMVIDSMDALIRRDDFLKEAKESEKVGAAGLLTSAMFKKVNLVLNKKGHKLFMIQQVRAKIQVSQYAPKDMNGSISGGGPNAITHSANQIWQVQPRSKSKNIEENGEIVGHWCEIKLTKGVKERTDITVKYPVKHGRKGGQSIWLEYELADLLVQWEMVDKAGAWLTLSDELVGELNEAGFEIEVGFKVQGNAKLKTWLEDNPDITKFLYKKFLALLSV